MKLEDTQTEMYQRAKAELLPGEDILWVGRANPRGMLFGGSAGGNKANIIGIVVGLQVLLVLGGVFFAFGFSRSSESSAVIGVESIPTTSSSGPPIIFMATIAILILVGLFAAMGIPLAKALKGRSMVYAITDRRVLMIDKNSVQSYGEQDIQFIKRKMNRDGTGDIIFREESQSSTGYYGATVFANRTHVAPVGFYGVPDPHDVEALMLETFRPETYARKQKNDDLWDEDEYFDDSEQNDINRSQR